MILGRPAEGDTAQSSRGLSAARCSPQALPVPEDGGEQKRGPATSLEKRKMKAVCWQSRCTWVSREEPRGIEMQRSRPPPGAATSLGNPFVPPGVIRVGGWLWPEAWYARGDSQTVAQAAKRVSFLTGLIDAPPPSLMPPPKRGRTGEAAHVGVTPHTGLKAEVEAGDDEVKQGGESESGKLGCEGG